MGMGWLSPDKTQMGKNLYYSLPFSKTTQTFKAIENTELGVKDLWQVTRGYLRLLLNVNLNQAFADYVRSLLRRFFVYCDLMESNRVRGQKKKRGSIFCSVASPMDALTSLLGGYRRSATGRPHRYLGQIEKRTNRGHRLVSKGHSIKTPLHRILSSLIIRGDSLTRYHPPPPPLPRGGTWQSGGSFTQELIKTATPIVASKMREGLASLEKGQSWRETRKAMLTAARRGVKPKSIRKRMDSIRSGETSSRHFWRVKQDGASPC